MLMHTHIPYSSQNPTISSNLIKLRKPKPMQQKNIPPQFSKIPQHPTSEILYKMQSDNEYEEVTDLHSSMSQLQKNTCFQNLQKGRSGLNSRTFQCRTNNYVVGSEGNQGATRTRGMGQVRRKTRDPRKFLVIQDQQGTQERLDTNNANETQAIKNLNHEIAGQNSVMEQISQKNKELNESDILSQQPNHQIFEMQISQNLSAIEPRSRLIFKIQSDQSNQQSQSDQEPNQSQLQPQPSMATTCQQPQLPIIDPSPETQNLSHKISQKFASFQDPKNMRIFLMTAIPEGVYFDFQIHQYKSFMKTQYMLWLVHGQNMEIFAKAVSDRVYIDKSVFRFSVCCRQMYKHVDKKELFLGEFVSDFKRQTYSLYDHKTPHNPSPSPPNTILCTVSRIPTLLNPKNKIQQLYIPTTTIQNTSLTKNLKKLHKIQQFKPLVRKFTTHGVQTKVIQHFQKLIKIVTNTTRNAVVRDQEMHARIVLFKMQPGRFRVRVGPGLMPVQMLAYAVVHLQ